MMLCYLPYSPKLDRKLLWSSIFANTGSAGSHWPFFYCSFRCYSCIIVGQYVQVDVAVVIFQHIPSWQL